SKLRETAKFVAVFRRRATAAAARASARSALRACACSHARPRRGAEPTHPVGAPEPRAAARDLEERARHDPLTPRRRTPRSQWRALATRHRSARIQPRAVQESTGSPSAGPIVLVRRAVTTPSASTVRPRTYRRQE